jgi:ankyrin repeat protein
VHDDPPLPAPPEQLIFDAVRAGDLAAVERELDSGRRADVTDDHGAPPLAWAAHYDRFDIVDLLIQRGADVDQRNTRTSKTTFQEFALYGRGAGDANVAADRMEALLQRGADPNVVTKDGSTALMLAARTGTAGKNLELLLKVTKDLNARNKEGKTALGLALQYGHRDVADRLTSKGATE